MFPLVSVVATLKEVWRHLPLTTLFRQWQGPANVKSQSFRNQGNLFVSLCYFSHSASLDDYSSRYGLIGSYLLFSAVVILLWSRFAICFWKTNHKKAEGTLEKVDLLYTISTSIYCTVYTVLYRIYSSLIKMSQQCGTPRRRCGLRWFLDYFNSTWLFLQAIFFVSSFQKT